MLPAPDPCICLLLNLQHLLILIENRLIELDFSIPMDPRNMSGIQPLLFGDVGPFLQPSADRLTARDPTRTRFSGVYGRPDAEP